MNVAVIVVTCGDDKWHELALSRAYPSASAEAHGRPRNGVVLRHYNDRSLAQARNSAARETAADWLCFLDADDELEPGYLDAMAQAFMAGAITTDWSPLLVPAVRYIPDEGKIQRIADGFEVPRAILGKVEPVPKIPNRGFWPTLNECVIGTLVRRDLFEAVGGFRAATDDGTPIPMYEDWDLWLRCWNSGAQLVYVEEAVYRAHGTPGGNERNLHGGESQKVYDAIWADHLTDREVLGR